MHTKTINYLICILPLLWGGCDLLESHPYDAHVTGETGINRKNTALIEERLAGKDTVRFAFITDTQRWYDETRLAVRHINARGDIDFVLHGGDQSDFGVTKEFLWMRDILNGLEMPYVCVIGNHDCLGTGNQTYETIYGNPDFSFIAGKVKFVCLNTNAIEYDYSRPVPNFDFMEAERSADSLDFDRTVVCMHAPPYSEQFNNNVAKVFNYYIHDFPRLLFCLDGHGHHTKTEDLYNNGTLFYMASSVHFRQYYIFTITPKDYHVEVIDF